MAAFPGVLLPLLPAAIAAAIAWTVLAALLRRRDLLPLAMPDARSLHTVPVPRGGGMAVWAGWLAGTLWLPGDRAWLAPLLAVIAVSLWDDWRGLHPAARLAVHAGAAALWLWLAGFAVNALFAIVAIVWMANLYNFMDGADGLAATMAILGFAAYAAGAGLAGAESAPLLLALAAATVPFLFRNVPPARVFLGDAGSVPLGFLAAVFGLTGWARGWWPAWFPPLVFLPFIADATITLARRLLRGARVWEAHREHYYQRLVQAGWGHGRTLVLEAALMLGTAASAIGALALAPAAGPALLASWSTALALLYAAIGYHCRRRQDPGTNASKH